MTLDAAENELQYIVLEMENNVEEHMQMDESNGCMEGLEDLSVGVSGDEAPCDTSYNDAISVEANEGIETRKAQQCAQGDLEAIQKIARRSKALRGVAVRLKVNVRCRSAFFEKRKAFQYNGEAFFWCLGRTVSVTELVSRENCFARQMHEMEKLLEGDVLVRTCLRMENNVEEHMQMDESDASMEGLEDLSLGSARARYSEARKEKYYNERLYVTDKGLGRIKV
ncbi:hypothetical protein TSUD_235820 [Trifolium subterraneum]|nr:hypothetical protein TSUD_235820 [Trifolium subterraneum]